jgi:hypothetical protein
MIFIYVFCFSLLQFCGRMNARQPGEVADAGGNAAQFGLSAALGPDLVLHSHFHSGVLLIPSLQSPN